MSHELIYNNKDTIHNVKWETELIDMPLKKPPLRGGRFFENNSNSKKEKETL